MFIDWGNIETKELPINYFGVTLSGDNIIKNCIYYRYKQYRAFKENCAIEYLKNRGYITLFEIGYDDTNAVIKSNYHVHSDYYDILLQVFSEKFSFFDRIVLQKLFLWQDEHHIKLFNTSMSVEQSEKDMSKIKRICLYFSIMQGNLSIELLDDLIYKIFRQQKAFVYPNGECSWLHLISIDFRDDGIKLKFYYGMKLGFDYLRFEKSFGNLAIIKDIFHTNGFLEGFQVALAKSEQITYNFYFKKPLLEHCKMKQYK